ncbi:MAG: chondroitinase-B domain-containing protein [Micromonosporaceae bacterium]
MKSSGTRLIWTAMAAFTVVVAATASAVTASAVATRVIPVSSIAELQSAANQAQPGDRIELADGVYTTTGAIRLTRSGTPSAPITIAAANVGRAEIRGSAGFALQAIDRVVLSGFRLTHQGGLSIPDGADHVRFTRNVVRLPGTVGNWLTVVGNDAQVDHNDFRYKSTQGVFLQVTGPGEREMAKRTWVHHNYFADHTFTGSNGGESIRLGYSSRQLSSAYAVIENNLFERADGDSEAISVKSSDNTVRHNTLRDSRGSIVLRHGNRNRVDGNLMLGGSSGMRFYDNDHVLVNNVIQGGNGQIIAGSGTVADDTSWSTAHARPDRVLVAFNTVVGNRTALLQVGQGTDRLGPNECTFANNIFVGGGSGALLDIDEGTNLRWEGNLVWAGSGGNAPSSGYRVTDPRLVTDAGGLRRLSATSPAIDAAVGAYPQVDRDLDLQPRSGAKDVGADEYAATGTERRPLIPADVGPYVPSTATTWYEAEHAICQGTVDSNHYGFSGTGFCNTTNAAGAYVEWTVQVATAGTYPLRFRYANGGTVERPMVIAVDGESRVTLPFAATGAWSSWQTATIELALAAGTHAIRATATTATGGPNLDYLRL